jgi:hypothetical protein
MPGYQDMHADQGATFTEVITWQNPDSTFVDLTDAVVAMSVSPPLNITAPIIHLTSAGEGITLGGVLGTITLTISAALLLSAPYGEFVYDIYVVIGDAVTKLLYGSFFISREVTAYT